MNIHSLRVNDVREPIGIDPDQIVFSWIIDGKAHATHSQVFVATGEAKLSADSADVWMSETISGMHHIPYKGSELAGLTEYWWRVAVKTEDGGEYYSEAERFETGPGASDWIAEWIWSSQEDCVNDFAFFRKEFQFQKTVSKARLYFSAHNTAQIYMNAQRISGFVSPAPTNPEKRKYYLAYNVTDLLNRTPSVCISATALYLGGNGQNYVNGLPGFRLQLELWYTDGSRQTVGTDSSWSTLRESPYELSAPYQQLRRISPMERFDARKLPTDWQLPGGDSPLWTLASKALIAQNEWPMKRQYIPEGAVDRLITPTDVTPPGETSRQVFDAGSIVSGWVRCRIQGIRGTTVRVRYSEDLDEQGYVKHNVCNEPSSTYYDEYMMRGDDEEVWEANHSYKAFRYIEITGYPEALVPGQNIWVVYAHTDIPQTGSFNSSSALLNQLYEASVQTQKNNTLGQIVDCPHREQAQYLADSDLQAELLFYNFDARHAIEKVLSDFTDGQLQDGTFPFVFPSNYKEPEFHIQIPEWDLHYCSLMWKLYYMYGDIGILARCYETAKRMVDYYLGIIDPAVGLVPTDKGWHISDWPYPTVEHEGEYLTVQNIKLFAAVTILVQSAQLLGRQNEGKGYLKKADALKENILKHLYDLKYRRFRSSIGSSQAHQGVNALALYNGLVPEQDRASILEFISTKEWESKTVLSLPLLRALFENGKQEEAFRLIHKGDYPGWGYMMMQGSKTMWEGWDDIESHSHAWNGYPARLLQEFIAGIQPSAPGFAKVRIQPFMPAELDYAEASVCTVRGQIRVRWERQGDGSVGVYTLIPASAEAELIVNGTRRTLPSGESHVIF